MAGLFITYAFNILNKPFPRPENIFSVYTVLYTETAVLLKQLPCPCDVFRLFIQKSRCLKIRAHLFWLAAKKKACLLQVFYGLVALHCLCLGSQQTEAEL